MANSVQERSASRSSARSTDSCVNVERKKDTVRLRDNKSGRTLLKITPEEWRAFVSGVKAGNFNDRAMPQQVRASPLAAFLLEVIRDATADDDSQGRVLRFWRFVRATGLVFAGVAIGGAIVVGAAVAGGAALTGIRPHVALGLGACGGATFLLAATFRAGRCILALARALSDNKGKGSGTPAP